MGGIFGVVCREQVRDGVVFGGLKRLLYHGYDGAEVAFLDEEGGIVARKAPGHFNEVAKKIVLVPLLRESSWSAPGMLAVDGLL